MPSRRRTATAWCSWPRRAGPGPEGTGVLKLTLRNLLARKVRLVMSGLAIVLGVAFLSGVLVFSNGLSTTFDGIIHRSTPDGVVRAKDFAEFDAGYSGTPTNV